VPDAFTHSPSKLHQHCPKFHTWEWKRLTNPIHKNLAWWTAASLLLNPVFASGNLVGYPDTGWEYRFSWL